MNAPAANVNQMLIDDGQVITYFISLHYERSYSRYGIQLEIRYCCVQREFQITSEVPPCAKRPSHEHRILCGENRLSAPFSISTEVFFINSLARFE